MRWTYSVDGEELRVVESATGRTSWKGKPDRHLVAKIVPLPADEDCVVLLKWWPGPGRDFPNLVRCRSDGSVVWRTPVARPGSQDCYSDVWWDDGRLLAYAISGYSVQVDVVSGAVLSKTFVK